jgi:hypothetical protein
MAGVFGRKGKLTKALHFISPWAGIKIEITGNATTKSLKKLNYCGLPLYFLTNWATDQLMATYLLCHIAQHLT